MKNAFRVYIFTLLLILLFSRRGSGSYSTHAQEAASPIPTYDPLKEPFLPDHPTQYELGRNWYWHYCMPCHGDKGQGLTNEWRAVWEPDHQDCWGKGCHAGEGIEDSFVIPTVVPPIVNSGKLARFSSVNTLYEYLETTHPPQHPGWLENDQYRAIALFIFSQNGRQLVETNLTPTIAPTETRTPLPDTIPVDNSSQPIIMILFAGLGIFLVGFVIGGIWKRR